jgi:general secretion pathway protein L
LAITATALAAELAAIWRWWLAALVDALPSTVPVRAEVSEAGGLTLRRGAALFDCEGQQRIPAKFAAPARLLLPAQWGLVRDIELPVAAGNHLQSVARFEIDRHTPFSADMVTHVAAILGPGRAAETLLVRLLVVPNRHLQPLLARAKALGVRVAGAQLQGTDMAVPVGGAHRSPLSALVPWAAVLLALVLASGSANWRYGALLADLQPQVALARQQALAAADNRQDEGKRLLALMAALPRAWPPSLLAVLEDLSARLPDDASVSRLHLTGTTLQIEGQAAAAAGLVAVLENSPLIDSVGFLAPTVRDGASGNERFQFAIQLRTRGAP